jgi:hypothetical protein
MFSLLLVKHRLTKNSNYWRFVSSCKILCLLLNCDQCRSYHCAYVCLNTEARWPGGPSTCQNYFALRWIYAYLVQF